MMLTFVNHAHVKLIKPKSIRLWFGWVLSFLAWVMMLTPLISPLWLKNPTLGHGVCIELVPVVMASQSIHNQGMSSEHHAMHHHHMMQHAYADKNFSDVKQSKIPHDPSTHHKDKQDKLNHHHDCDICLSLMLFALGASLPLLVLLALVFTERLVTKLRQLRLQYLFFLRPPSRASPALLLN